LVLRPTEWSKAMNITCNDKTPEAFRNSLVADLVHKITQVKNEALRETSVKGSARIAGRIQALISYQEFLKEIQFND
jgi:hypothetical protein